MKKALILAAIAASGLTAVAAGPRVSLQDSTEPPAIPPDIAQFLEDQERRFDDITAGAEKTIRWHNAERPEKTHYALVYLHGFSATRQETSPLTEQLADQLGANVYFTRLRGHGRGSAPMAQVQANDWLEDTREAFAIGRSIGEKVVVIGVSTGATLATWLGMQADHDELAGVILISPNFGLADTMAGILTLPWGLQVAELATGESRSFKASNAQHEKYWTTSYALSAAAQMMALLDYVNAMPLEEFDRPVLYIRSDSDRVIDMAKADAVFATFATKTKEQVVVTNSDDPYGHVIAGDILSPSSTAELQQAMAKFIENLP